MLDNQSHAWFWSPEGWWWLANGSLKGRLLNVEVSGHVCNDGSLTIDVARVSFEQS